MAAQQWEYLVIRLTDARATHISERLNQHAAEGYEPIMMCGDVTLSLLLRKPKEETPAPAES
ncbi:MAG: hypothetical protein FJX75_10715 [Armatimonadetes bacterium]|nr:hypothetical protein [Armatimonadota bacterium]